MGVAPGVEPSRIVIDVMCGAVAIGIAVSGALADRKIGRPAVDGGPPRTHGTAKIDSATILAVGLTLWPPLFDLTAGYASLSRRPALWLAFVWPLATIMFDLGIGTQSTAYGQVLHPLQTPMHGTQENTAILAVALAIGTILTSGRQSPETQQVALPLLMAGVAMTIAFVLPVPTIAPDSDLGINIRMAQKGVFFNYAVGLMLASIFVAFRMRATSVSGASPASSSPGIPSVASLAVAL
jgi:hypothetical protein